MKFLALTFILITTQFAHASNCWRYLAESKNIEVTNSTTDNFIAFLDVMLQEHVINNDYLEKLTKGEIINPLDKEIISDSNHHIYKETFQEFINAQPDKKQLMVWAMQLLTKNKKTRQGKEQTKEKTKRSSMAMEFLRIEPGPFVINKNNPQGTKYSVTLTHPFEMMSTSVTQAMWNELMGTMPKQAERGVDYPITNITWWSAVAFANKLSEKHNLPPAYPLAEVQDWEGNAAQGTLKPKDPKLAQLVFKFMAKNIYKSKGYRLPTVYESIFVSSDRGRSNTQTFTNMDKNNISKHAFIDINKDRIVPVGSVLPFIIDGQSFYDLYGNVMEWLHDQGTSSWVTDLNEGTDPVDIKNSNPDFFQTRLARSNYSSNDAKEMNSFNFSGLEPFKVYFKVGFRLVRSLDK